MPNPRIPQNAVKSKYNTSKVHDQDMPVLSTDVRVVKNPSLWRNGNIMQDVLGGRI